MPARARRAGLTLVEVLVALFVMSLMTALSWRSVDAMLRGWAAGRLMGDELRAVQAGLGQWEADMDALVETGVVSALEFDGLALRMTRANRPRPGEGRLVVAWALRPGADGAPRWTRWQSPPLHTRAQLQQAWQQAALWAQGHGGAAAGATPVALAGAWSVLYFRGGAWSNALSSADRGPVTVVPLPDAVQLTLDLAPGHAVGGRLVKVWVRPDFAGRAA